MGAGWAEGRKKASTEALSWIQCEVMAAEAFLAFGSSPCQLPSAGTKAAAWPVDGLFGSVHHGWGSPSVAPVGGHVMTCIAWSNESIFFNSGAYSLGNVSIRS